MSLKTYNARIDANQLQIFREVFLNIYISLSHARAHIRENFQNFKKLKTFEFVGKDYIYSHIINNFTCHLTKLSTKNSRIISLKVTDYIITKS